MTLRRLVRARGDALVSRPFVGRVENGVFKFRRNIISRNSFMPVVIGRIVPGEAGALVRGTVRLSCLGAAFMTLWIVIPIIAVVDAVPRCFSGCDTSNVLRAVFFPLFAVMLVAFGSYPGYPPERLEAIRTPADSLLAGRGETRVGAA